jgi:di/tricarboxylate transporter
MGTSTNLLVSSIAVNYGLPKFGIFEFSLLGLVFFGGGLIYMLLIGRFLIPNRTQEGDLTNQYEMQDYLTEIKILAGSKFIGKQLQEISIFNDEEIDVLEIKRGIDFSFFLLKRIIFKKMIRF